MTRLFIVAVLLAQTVGADPPATDERPFNPLRPGLIVDVPIETIVHPDPEILLDEVLAAKGPWEQMCGAFIHTTAQPRIPLFGYERQFVLHYIAPEGFERLRDHRQDIVDVVRARMASLIPEVTERAARTEQRLKEALQAAPSTNPDVPQAVLIDGGSQGENTPLDQYLMVVLDLNATEALPGLLKLEAALNDVALYQSPLWGDLESNAEYSAVELVASLATRPHARVLSVITALLRNEDYPPLQESRLYARYTEDYLALVSQHAGNASGFSLSAEPVETPPEAPAIVAELVRLRDRDPQRLDGRLSVPYDQEMRDEIVVLAIQFLKDVKPYDFVAADGMAAIPRRR